LLINISAYAMPSEKYFHVYGAFGEIYSLGSIRVGVEDWEGGLLNQRSIGIAKLNYVEEFYSGFGFIMNQNSSVGIYAALGLEYAFWKIFTFRTEANVSYGVDNFSHAEALLGLTVYF